VAHGSFFSYGNEGLTKPGTKPIGTDPFTANGITMRRSWEMLQGVQALWFNGVLLGVFHIGEEVPGIIADCITLHPIDYELAKKCEMESRVRDRSRRFHENRFKLPADTSERIIRKVRETQRNMKDDDRS
jgi:hypothetical protein